MKIAPEYTARKRRGRSKTLPTLSNRPLKAKIGLE